MTPSVLPSQHSLMVMLSVNTISLSPSTQQVPVRVEVTPQQITITIIDSGMHSMFAYNCCGQPLLEFINFTYYFFVIITDPELSFTSPSILEVTEDVGTVEICMAITFDGNLECDYVVPLSINSSIASECMSDIIIIHACMYVCMYIYGGRYKYLCICTLISHNNITCLYIHTYIPTYKYWYAYIYIAAGGDYQGGDNVITFSEGAPSGSIACTDITIIDDDELEGEHEIVISVPGMINSITVVIEDNESKHYITSSIPVVSVLFLLLLRVPTVSCRSCHNCRYM